MPDRKRLDSYLDGIYGSARLTNNGPLVQELTQRLEDYLGVKNLLLVANGTLALQVAYRALQLNGEPGEPPPTAVTTPFTFVATANSLRWEGIEPVFADIEPQSLNLSPAAAATRVDHSTRALVPVHVYGNPCDVQGLADLADRHGLRVVYDAAHAFGVSVEGRSVLQWGDASVLSFHATKVFHTVEGGGIVFSEADALERARELMNFGIPGGASEPRSLGINAKLSEVHAAFGLALLDDIDSIISRRNALASLYAECLADVVALPGYCGEPGRVAAYMPVLFASAEERSRCERALSAQQMTSRRYFTPSPGADLSELPIAGDIVSRILCLPLFGDMQDAEVRRIADVVKGAAA